ncbi:Serine/threonine-protein kinase/endoribonuclease IRE1 [Morus notabilis]|uniref:non-specific serine/threonine protein kinase n=1 Tax=Morus notabilis TaxID=981085 RepID=W9S225_9ROSA|nr:serine/threonine-protein kinase/endoribonuclease IRE1b [Morus notabilis]EXC21534.1 Serine/threonine-protein kinase/endoribonuclease IRE1 [Morus notabilis]
MEKANGSETSTMFQVNRRAFQPPNGSPITGETESRLESPGHFEIYRRAEITTSSSKVSLDDKQQQIGQKLFVSSKEIGKSGTGTVVYEGIYDNIAVAVKRILQSHDDQADREIKIFIAVSKESKNVIRYYGAERDKDFIYLVLERCDCNLDDLIQIYSTDSSQNKPESKEYLVELQNILGGVKLWEENNVRPSHLLLKLMRDMVSGLVVLHESGIVHRDLKPQNILIVKPQNILIVEENPTLCAKLADMGNSRQLRDDKSSFTNISRSGTMGWKARECLLAEERWRPTATLADQLSNTEVQRLTRSMDMFSLGCLLFYCITGGIHPFGDHDERNMNIRTENVKNMAMIQKFPEAFHLISPLLEADYNNRPKANEVLRHPLFWDAKKRLSFLSDISDRLSKNSNISNVLESTANTIFETETMCCFLNVVLRWNKKVHAEIIKHVSTNAKSTYNFSSVGDLLRLIGEILKNYQQLPDTIQILVGPQYEGLNDYFTRRFPMLLIEVYKVVYTHCKEEEYFNKYFKEI